MLFVPFAIVALVSIAVSYSLWTERRRLVGQSARAHLRLGEMRERLDAALEASDTGTFRWALATGRIRCDRSLGRLFGFADPERLTTVHDLVPFAHPNDRDAVRSALTQTEIPSAGLSLEFRLSLPRQHVRWMLLKARRSAVSPDGVTVACTDITPQRLAQDSLGRSEERYRSLVAATSALVFSTDASGSFRLPQTAWEAHTGQNWEESRGWGWLNAVHEEDRERIRTTWVAAINSGTPYSEEARLWHAASGTYRYFEGRAIPLRTRAGHIREWVGLVTDVEKRRVADESLRRHAAELARSNQELEQFAYVASHDLKEPLRIVSVYVGLLRRRVGSTVPGPVEECLTHIVEGAERMTNLVSDLLAYSRVARHAEPQALVDTTAIVKTVVTRLQRQIEASGASFDVERLPSIVGNAAQIEQLFVQLLSNALKFRGDTKPRIRVFAEAGLRQATLCVNDNGIGVDPRFGERIFALFQRLHAARQYPGTGIGLAICKRVAENHGGKIWVDSQPGEGATFRVTFPQARTQRKVGA